MHLLLKKPIIDLFVFICFFYEIYSPFENNSDSSYLLLDKKVNCKIGAKGIGIKTREGDFITPKGIFSLEKVFFRADRVKNQKHHLK